jgi:hypothetical protein
LTAAALASLGLTDVTDSNLAAVLEAIAASADNGSGVDTRAELQALVTSAVSAFTAGITEISAFNGTQTGAAVPDAQTYAQAGVTGVTSSNLAAINSVLAAIDTSATNTAAEIQAIVDTYNLLLAGAEGATNNQPALTAAQYQTLGLSSVDTAAEAVLLNQVIDSFTDTG